MKKKLYLLIVAILPMMASAYQAKIDGIYYDFNTSAKTATVTYRNYSAANQTTNATAYSGVVNIPATVYYSGVTYNVTQIRESAFLNCKGVTSVTIPSSIIYIGDWAFLGCTGLTSVFITDLSAWFKITFGRQGSDSNPLFHAHHLYLNGEEIKDLVIPEDITSLNNSVFINCTGLTSVTIPNNVTSIHKHAFYGCSGLTSIIVENGNTVFDSRINCNAIIETETNELIVGCKSTIIPNSVTSIGHSAFGYDRSPSSLVIPNSVKTIGDEAFCFNYGLISVTIGDSVTNIGDCAFMSCTSLTAVIIPDNVTSIGADTFIACRGLTSIIIGKSVTSIGEEAFFWCDALESVTALPETPPSLYDNSFSNYNIPLYASKTAIAKYKNTSPWSKFAQFLTLDGQEVEVKKCAMPTIAYMKGKLMFDCDTKGAEIVYETKNYDNINGRGGEVSLSRYIEISAYATLDGYDDSDVATATIRWRDGRPLFEGFSSVIVNQQEASDTNGDATVDVADIATIIDAMASKSREEREE